MSYDEIKEFRRVFLLGTEGSIMNYKKIIIKMLDELDDTRLKNVYFFNNTFSFINTKSVCSIFKLKYVLVISVFNIFVSVS